MLGSKSKCCFRCCQNELKRSVLIRQIFKILIVFLLMFFVKLENSYGQENDKSESKLVVYDNTIVKIDLEITSKSDKIRPLVWQLLGNNNRIIATGKSVVDPMQKKVAIALNIPKLQKDVILKTSLNYLVENKKSVKKIIIIDKDIVKKKLFKKCSLRIINSDLYLKLKKYFDKNVNFQKGFSGKKKSKLSDFTIMLVDDYNKNYLRLSKDVNNLLINGKRVFLIADNTFELNLPENNIQIVSIRKQYEMPKKKINLRVNGNLLAENMVRGKNRISLNIKTANKTKLKIYGEIKNKKNDLIENQFVRLKYQKGELIIFNYNIFEQLKINPLAGLLLLELEKENEK